MHGSPTTYDGAAGVCLPSLRALSLSLFPLYLGRETGSSLCTSPENTSLENISPFWPRLIDDSPFHLVQPFPDLRMIWFGRVLLKDYIFFHAISKAMSIKAMHMNINLLRKVRIVAYQHNEKCVIYFFFIYEIWKNKVKYVTS